MMLMTHSAPEYMLLMPMAATFMFDGTALRSSTEGGNFFNGTKHKMILSCKHKYKYKKHKTSQYTVTHSRFPCYVLFTFNYSNTDKLSGANN